MTDRVLLTIFGASALAATLAGQSASAQTVDELRTLSIEELSSVEITSVFKRAVSLSDAPASIYVITNEQILRSPVLTLPDVLRLAPNLNVARQDAQQYAIAPRGFNSIESSVKSLGLIDGRSIYTALHGGVFWDQQQVPLADIERIEVISGPAGAIWGANAFNGVINVITKSADKTQGFLADMVGGTVDQKIMARYGGALSNDAHFRVYGLLLNRGETLTPAGAGRNDDWTGRQGGFRMDWRPNYHIVTLQGDYFSHRTAGSGELSGGNVLTRWQMPLGEDAQLHLQGFYDAVSRDAPGVTDTATTLDIQADINASFGAHMFVAGAGHRMTDDEFVVTGSPFFLLPAADTVSVSNIFVQDSFALSEGLTATLGLKYEYSSFSEGEFLPDFRLAWKLSPDTLLWSAVSRAVRTPTHIDRSLVGPGILERAVDFQSEDVLAYEAGYRGRIFPNMSLSVSLFYNDYDDLRVLTIAPSLLLKFGNRMHGAGYGAEVWGEIQALDWWRFSGGFNLLYKDLDLEPGAVNLALVQHAGNDPEYQFQLRSQMDMADGLAFDVTLRGVGELRDPAIPGYVAVDTRLAWRATDALEISFAARNLFDEHHPETGSAAARGEIPRNIMLGLRAAY